MTIFRHSFRRFGCALLAAWCVGSPGAFAGDGSVASLTAAFIFNFAKFTEWPAEALVPGQRVSLCVDGDRAVADAIEETIKGRTIEGHELTVSLVRKEESVATCHILYVDAVNPTRAAKLLANARGAAVFTVGSAPDFTESGGVAQLIVEDSRMRFAINTNAAERQRLRLSSRLLSLAKIVKDGQRISR